MIPFISRHIPTAAQIATVRERFGELALPESIVFEAGRVSEQMVLALEHAGLDRHAGHRGPSSEGPDGFEVGFANCASVEYRCADDPRVVAGVFPGWALLELLRSGWTVVELVNEPSARSRGAFVCRGAYVHTLQSSEFIACPIPVADQESSPLLAGLKL